jgi:hypothetical protein
MSTVSNNDFRRRQIQTIFGHLNRPEVETPSRVKSSCFYAFELRGAEGRADNVGCHWAYFMSSFLVSLAVGIFTSVM